MRLRANGDSGPTRSAPPEIEKCQDEDAGDDGGRAHTPAADGMDDEQFERGEIDGEQQPDGCQVSSRVGGQRRAARAGCTAISATSRSPA
jgi:hypothetical protein